MHLHVGRSFLKIYFMNKRAEMGLLMRNEGRSTGNMIIDLEEKRRSLLCMIFSSRRWCTSNLFNAETDKAEYHAVSQ